MSSAIEPQRSDRRLPARDGTLLFCRSWLPPSVAGAVLLVHGLAEHSGRYDETATELVRRGYACWAVDVRGHGRSEGLTGHVHDFDDYLEDVAALREQVARAHPGRPQVLIGHSQGGLIALLSALTRPEGLDALVLSSPLLGVHPSLQLPKPLHVLALVLARVMPRLRIASGLVADHLSRDPAVVAGYLGDPLVSRSVSLGWYAALQRALERAWREAPELRVRTLIAYAGSDRLVDPAAPPRWAERATGARVTLRDYPGLYHEILNEPERDGVRADVLSWLEERSG